MLEWQKRGVKSKGIAQRLGVSVRTIQNWKKRGSCPGGMRRRKRQSLFDPYAPYVLSQWQQECRDVAPLLQEIQAQGYTGQIRTVYRFIQTLKQDVGSLPPLSVLDRVSVREALWLMVRPRASLQEKERIDLETLCHLSSKLSALYTLVQDFGQMVRQREAHRFLAWKQQVAEGEFLELQRFATGLERDQEAVLAGLSQSYSNGMAEGFVNKLKLIKRQSYGRASFPLLRQRVLHAL